MLHLSANHTLILIPSTFSFLYGQHRHHFSIISNLYFRLSGLTLSVFSVVRVIGPRSLHSQVHTPLNFSQTVYFLKAQHRKWSGIPQHHRTLIFLITFCFLLYIHPPFYIFCFYSDCHTIFKRQKTSTIYFH